MDDKPQATQDHKPTLSRKWMPVLSLFVIGLLFVGQWWLSSPSVQQLPYSVFKAALRQGLIRKAQIGKTRIRGTHLIPAEQAPDRSLDDTALKHSGRFETIRVDDPGLVRELEAHQVSYAGRREGGWFTTLLGWLFPAILMLGLWGLMARRMGRAGASMESGSGAPFRFQRAFKVEFSR